MKLLILTQKIDINDDILGFMHGWVQEFAKQCEYVIVICLQKGEYDLPKNVKIISLGKEKGKSKIKYLFNFYKYIWQERNSYDKVLVHMNHEYVILGGLFWRLWKKKISLWYAHGHVPSSLRIAEKLSHIVFTSTKSGFRLESKKLNIIGQGINTNNFQFPISNFQSNSKFHIITIGRISPVKDYETLINAVELLIKEGQKIEVKIIGAAGLPEQERYLKELKKIVKDKKLEQVIKFIGAVPNKDIVDYLREADLFVNMSHTGSLDKAMLEAMASRVILLTCNEALEDVLGDYKDKLMYKKSDYKELAEKIKMIIKMASEGRIDLGDKLRKIVIRDHDLENFIKKIITQLNYD